MFNIQKTNINITYKYLHREHSIRAVVTILYHILYFLGIWIVYKLIYKHQSVVECSWQSREAFRRLLQHLVKYFLGCCCCYWHTWTLSYANIVPASIPPGKAPLSQRTVSSLAEHAPLPGTWHPVHLQPAGRGRSCRHPTRTR